MPRLGKTNRNRQRWLHAHAQFYQRENAGDDSLVLRGFTLRAVPDTIDDAARSVEAVIATETPAVVFDPGRWAAIDEVLRMDGAELPSQMPLLETHDRTTIDAVLGSIRQLRFEGEKLVGRLVFATGDARAEAAWNKVRQGHVTDVSVGYRVDGFEDLEPGQSKEVAGRKYTANQRTLRITRRWTPREGSLVAVGADPRAKMRHEHGPENVSRANSPGDPGASTAGGQPMANESQVPAAADPTGQSAVGVKIETPAEGQGQRTAPQVPTPAATIPPAVAGASPDVVAQERGRVLAILELARDDVPQTLARMAIDEGWSQERASAAFLEHIRGARTPQGQAPASGPAIHVRGRELDMTRQSLAAGLLMGRTSIDPIAGMVEVHDGVPMRRRKGAAVLDLEQAADRGYRYRGMSLRDACAEACRMDGLNFDRYSDTDLMRAATSSGTLTAIFTTLFSAQLLAGYQDYPDTTVGWTSESDVPNFQSNERAQMGKMGNLTKHRRGGVADDMDTSDSKETYKVARYSGKFTIDEMDLVDDRFGALEQTSPVEMGLAAAALRPNLVYYHLLANAALGADSVALFDATTHANYATTASAMTAVYLQTAIAAMGKQRIRTRPLNVTPRFLLVPQDLRFLAEILLTSAQRFNTTDIGNKNPLLGVGIEIRFDDRLGVAGVTDPSTGTAQAGTATNWFLAARPGEGGAKTIEVGYLRGKGRAPSIRPYTLDKGQWGVGWDVVFDIGCKALDFRGLYKATGAAA
jgi:hypothetical protein